MRENYYSPQGMHAEVEDLLRAFREDMPGTVMEMVPMYLIETDYEKKSMTTVIHPTHWMADRTGGMSNGAFATALDMTMGILCLYFVNGMTPTVTMQLSLLRPIPLDRDLYIRAKLVNTDGTKMDVTAQAWSEGMEESPDCTAVGIYYRGGIRRPLPGHDPIV